MLCDVCKKNTATVHLTEIIKDKVIEMHICQRCARSKTEEIKEQIKGSDFAEAVGLASRKERREDYIKCPDCGMFYKDFKKKGRLGCGKCYSAFKDMLVPLLKRVHTATYHIGKYPLGVEKRPYLQNDVEELDHCLRRAVELEQYEEAARLRDKIKEIEKKKS